MAKHVRREEHRESLEVHVAGICLRWENGNLELLLAKRSGDRELYPGLWEGCGGQLRCNESFAGGVARHFRDEMGIGVIPLQRFHGFYEIQVGDLYFPGLYFLCKYEEGKPESRNHTAVRWASYGDFLGMPRESFPPSFKDSVLRMLELYLREGVAADDQAHEINNGRRGD